MPSDSPVTPFSVTPNGVTIKPCYIPFSQGAQRTPSCFAPRRRQDGEGFVPANYAPALVCRSLDTQTVPSGGNQQGWNVYLRRPTTGIKCPVVDSPIPKPNSGSQELINDWRINALLAQQFRLSRET